MTKAYNATLLTTHQNILSKFKRISKDTYERNNIILDVSDIIVISRFVYDSTNEGNVLQNLSVFMKFLKSWALVSAKLDTPLVWKTPAGIEVMASAADLLPYTYGRVILDGVKIAIKGVKRDTKISSRKQVNSLAPNLIHSLDASHLTMVTTEWYKTHSQLVVIHDCFGTTLKNVPDLHYMIREQFASLYCSNFLTDFHTQQLQQIQLKFNISEDIKGKYVDLEPSKTKKSIVRLPSEFTIKNDEKLLDIGRAIYNVLIVVWYER